MGNTTALKKAPVTELAKPKTTLETLEELEMKKQELTEKLTAEKIVAINNALPILQRVSGITYDTLDNILQGQGLRETCNNVSDLVDGIIELSTQNPVHIQKEFETKNDGTWLIVVKPKVKRKKKDSKETK